MDGKKIEIKDGADPAIDEGQAAVAETPEAEVYEAAPQLAEAAGDDDALLLKSRECDELREQLLRHRAEFDNYRKRMARDAEQTRKTAAEGLVRSLLPVVDNLERALKHAEDPDGALAQGVGMVLKQLCDALAAQGLEPIAAVGENFDPNVHEALAQQPSAEFAADTVITEFERGYRLNGFVVRPAKVVISTGAPAPVEDGGENVGG